MLTTPRPPINHPDIITGPPPKDDARLFKLIADARARRTAFRGAPEGAYSPVTRPYTDDGAYYVQLESVIRAIKPDTHAGAVEKARFALEDWPGHRPPMHSIGNLFAALRDMVDATNEGEPTT